MNSSAYSRVIATPPPHLTSPLDDGKTQAGESIAASTMMNSTKDGVSSDQRNVSNMLTAPVYALF